MNVPSTTFRSTASYTCDSGFIIVGVQTRECQGNEEWSDEAPTCERESQNLVLLQQQGRIAVTFQSFNTCNSI